MSSQQQSSICVYGDSQPSQAADKRPRFPIHLTTECWYTQRQELQIRTLFHWGPVEDSQDQMFYLEKQRVRLATIVTDAITMLASATTYRPAEVGQFSHRVNTLGDRLPFADNVDKETFDSRVPRRRRALVCLVGLEQDPTFQSRPRYTVSELYEMVDRSRDIRETWNPSSHQWSWTNGDDPKPRTKLIAASLVSARLMSMGFGTLRNEAAKKIPIAVPQENPSKA